MNSAMSLLFLLAPVAMAAAHDEIHAALVNRVDEAHKTVGIVVGIIDARGREVLAYGKADRMSALAPDGDTIFEIGSLTKVFTSLVLADMIERGEVKPDDPVAKYLPADAKVPGRNGRQITLLDLSMQISGLPRLPDNLQPADQFNPYTDYTDARLLDFLSRYALTRDIGEKYEYSNLGVGLLGFALARKAGVSYEEMVRRRILEPLGMTSTTITLTTAQKKRLAAGHSAGLERVPNWDFDALAGCGAIRSTANDLLKFLSAHLELTDTPLRPAIRRMRSVHHDTGTPDLEIMMGWHVWHRYGTDIVWHNGGTYGYHSFAGFDPAKQTGVVVLCNSGFDIDDIGRHILEGRWPLQRYDAAKERTGITLAPEVLQRYVGDYQFAPRVILKVAREGPRILIQLTGQPAVEMFAEKEDEFFLKVVDAQLRFVKDEAGIVTGVILHQGGLDQKAARVPAGK